MLLTCTLWINQNRSEVSTSLLRDSFTIILSLSANFRFLSPPLLVNISHLFICLFLLYVNTSLHPLTFHSYPSLTFFNLYFHSSSLFFISNFLNLFIIYVIIFTYFFSYIDPISQFLLFNWYVTMFYTMLLSSLFLVSNAVYNCPFFHLMNEPCLLSFLTLYLK